VLLAPDGVRADVTVGPYQVDPGTIPEGGTLALDMRSLIGSSQGVSFLAEYLVDEITASRSIAAGEHISSELVLPDSYLQHSGLGTLNIDTNGDIVISKDAGIEALPATAISLTGSVRRS